MNGIIVMTILMASSISFAQGDKNKSDGDKLDLKKLEQKYWSAKDDDFSVIQNRAYTKANRWYLSLGAGIPINDPYAKGTITELTAGYFTSERWGYEYTYENAGLQDNEAVQQFINDHGTVPNHNTLKSAHTFKANYVPFYAKMSFLDKSIIYFDMGISFGLGLTNFEQVVSTGNRSQSALHYEIDLNQTFFFTEKSAFRLDFKNRWTNEERMRYKLNVSEAESARSLGDKSTNDTSLMFSYVYWH